MGFRKTVPGEPAEVSDRLSGVRVNSVRLTFGLGRLGFPLTRSRQAGIRVQDGFRA